METKTQEEIMYEEFLQNKDKLQVNTYTFSKQARMFKNELSEERLAYENKLQEAKKKKEEHDKDVHFRLWTEFALEDQNLECQYRD